MNNKKPKLYIKHVSNYLVFIVLVIFMLVIIKYLQLVHEWEKISLENILNLRKIIGNSIKLNIKTLVISTKIMIKWLDQLKNSFLRVT